MGQVPVDVAEARGETGEVVGELPRPDGATWEDPSQMSVFQDIIINPTILTCIVLTNKFEYEDCCEMFGRGPHCYRRSGVLSTDIIFTADCANVNKMTGTLTPHISNSTQLTFYWWV